MERSNDHIAIAISKGRITTAVKPLLEFAGVDPLEDLQSSRNLVFDTRTHDVQLIIVRSEDVPTYVRLGGADLGIVGKDILLEEKSISFYELVDLGISRCQLVLAGVKEPRGNLFHNRRKHRVATKYVNTARSYFSSRGVYADVMKLTGSMELAPLCGIADQIVDLSQTGETLRSNGLEKIDTIAEISARLIANRASMRLKDKAMKKIVRRFEEAARAYSNEA